MVEDKLKELNITLPDTSTTFGAYIPANISGNLIFISGQLPVKEGKLQYKGKLGSDLSVEEGYEAAKLSAINSLAVIKSTISDFSNFVKIVKVTGYVASSDGFNKQANVINGASELFFEVFGESGSHARVAIGVNELPLNSPVEIEVIAEISSDYSF